MIVLHGVLGNKINWKGLCSRDEVILSLTNFIILDSLQKKLLFIGYEKSHVI